MENAAVYYGTRKAGTLRRKETGYEFIYDPDYLTDPKATPISLSMPLTRTKYESARFFPFFDGLLPEGWLLELTCSAARIDKKDKFNLLLHTGGDPVGAVSVLRLED